MDSLGSLSMLLLLLLLLQICLDGAVKIEAGSFVLHDELLLLIWA
jgi:hypothetical protein